MTEQTKEMKSLNDVQAGDLLILNRRMDRQIVKVERTTKTQIIIGICDKYRKHDGGYISGTSYSYNYLSIPKDGEIEEVKRIQFIAMVSRKAARVLDIGNITYEQAVKIKKLLEL